MRLKLHAQRGSPNSGTNAQTHGTRTTDSARKADKHTPRSEAPCRGLAARSYALKDRQQSASKCDLQAGLLYSPSQATVLMPTWGLAKAEYS